MREDNGGMNAVRPAAVAGMFYPGDARALAAEIRDLLGDVQHTAPRLGYPKALVVPHAGYVYSGGVAARAYDELATARGRVRRVVLLGPTHRVAVRGLAAPSAQAFATPLGQVRVDGDAIASVRDLPQVVVNDAAHALEHSLEVQLPFLQEMLGDFALAPFAVGTASVQEVAQVLERLWGGPETLIVISTDLSHYHAYEQARAIDGATIERIAGFATDLDHDEACGATPLNGLLLFSKQKNLLLKLLAACNSGDTAGGKERVVGYSSFALYEGGEVSLEEAGKVLLSIARGAIEERAGRKKEREKCRRCGSPKPAPPSSPSPSPASCAAASAASRRRARWARTWRRTRSVLRFATRASPRSPPPSGRNAASRCRCFRRRSRSDSPAKPTCWRRSRPARTA